MIYSKIHKRVDSSEESNEQEVKVKVKTVTRSNLSSSDSSTSTGTTYTKTRRTNVGPTFFDDIFNVSSNLSKR